jgi:hypothetical protein
MANVVVVSLGWSVLTVVLFFPLASLDELFDYYEKEKRWKMRYLVKSRMEKFTSIDTQLNDCSLDESMPLYWTGFIYLRVRNICSIALPCH